ncbi:ligand-binding domain of nuclear hormone receptor domain-containing protein [Ditylenchus destructor]|uniref:Ligand-binding domain of nuclear hormone receptor domain-containing protein n=1 Tax=Ditylenchus destructor TaxID=166010 RepID=A0AAD4N803_9BILA|nr:ligand-binding domain of nuclear hormone receptor domain-containing protein [Ditylenchus destructor]
MKIIVQEIKIEPLNDDIFNPCTSHAPFYPNGFNNLLSRTDPTPPSQLCFDHKYSLPKYESTVFLLNEAELQPKRSHRKIITAKLEDDVKMPTKCLVCSNPTKCCHYDVPSCNACKVFFRRSLLSFKRNVCQFNATCIISGGIDRCRTCRFDRCIFLGMNPRAMNLPKTVDVQKLLDQVANRRRYLMQKYTDKYPVLLGKSDPMLEEVIENKIIQSFVYVELKVWQIRESSKRPSEQMICRSIRELLESNRGNLLAHADQYPKEQKWPLSVHSDIQEAIKMEIAERKPHWLIFDTLLCIEMIKTYPVFSLLDYNDKEGLLKQVILVNAILMQAFYSYQMKSETFILPNGFMPIKPRFVEDEIIMHAKREIFCRTLEPFFRAKMTMEEFVLLKAIIFSHYAIPELSARGKALLEMESIRYTKILMKHLQSRLGAVAGAKKYAEIISIVDCLFNTAQRVKGLYTYILSVTGVHYSVNYPPPIYSVPYFDTIMGA